MVALCALARSAAAADAGAVILQDLKRFNTMGTVLHVAAHPDDENTQLITALALGRNYRAAYLSVTRGDGGQNLIGPEFFEQLGVIRTQELLAARKLDGGLQFFTRAKDFGFSKDVNETLRIWDRQEVLGDVVRVIRTFRPDVIATQFNPDTGGTHGHHTASAVLGREAFKLAGDPKAFPEQVAELGVWQPKRVMMGNRGGGGGNNVAQIDVGGIDPVSGEAFNSIAPRSRAMHMSQFGTRGGRGAGRGGGGGPQMASFSLLGGDAATRDIMDGVDTTWARIPGGAEIGVLADQAIAQFKADNAPASIPALLAIRAKVAALPSDRLITEKRDLLDHIIQQCLGLTIQTIVQQAEIVPGEQFKIHHELKQTSNVPLRLTEVRCPTSGSISKLDIKLGANQQTVLDSQEKLPANVALTQPYWLREEGTVGMFRVDDPKLIGLPENPSVFPVEYVFDVNGQSIVLRDEPVQITGDKRRRLDVIPPVAMKFTSEVRVFSPSSARPVEVEMTSYRAGTNGKLELTAPAGWKVEPASQAFNLASVGEHAKFTFNVTAPAQPGSASVAAVADINGARFSNQRIEIRYDHIPLQLLQPPAKTKAVSLDLAIRGKNVGYLPGAGDTVAECIGQMGYTVTELTGNDLKLDRLKTFDAVVIGIRAFDTRTDFAPNLDALFAYIEAGGTVVTQYNRANVSNQQPGTYGPFRLQQSQLRVTDETAVMTFLAPDHPALNTPNKITQADFDGWVQERGVYYPSQWDERFKPILAANDPGEEPLQGGLLIAQHGKGYLVYTGLAFFRQLPEGVPGAYRLFANLISLGK